MVVELEMKDSSHLLYCGNFFSSNSNPWQLLSKIIQPYSHKIYMEICITGNDRNTFRIFEDFQSTCVHVMICLQLKCNNVETNLAEVHVCVMI